MKKFTLLVIAWGITVSCMHEKTAPEHGYFSVAVLKGKSGPGTKETGECILSVCMKIEKEAA